jgi:hypothetical protein
MHYICWLTCICLEAIRTAMLQHSLLWCQECLCCLLSICCCCVLLHPGRRSTVCFTAAGTALPAQQGVLP